MNRSDLDVIGGVVLSAFAAVGCLVLAAVHAERRLEGARPGHPVPPSVRRRSGAWATLVSRADRNVPAWGLALGATVLTAIVLVGATLTVDANSQPGVTDGAHSAAGRAVFGALAVGGDVRVAAPALAVVALWRSRRWRTPRPALVSAAAGALMSGCVLLLKVAVGRTAPGSAINDVVAGGTSYPSGHTATAAFCLVLAATLAAGLRAKSWVRATFTALAVAGSVAVGWATVALGFHWVTDVVGGLLIGALFAVLAGRCLHAEVADRPAPERSNDGVSVEPPRTGEPRRERDTQRQRADVPAPH